MKSTNDTFLFVIGAALASFAGFALFEMYKSPVVGTGGSSSGLSETGMVPSGANVTYANGTVDTLSADTPITTLQAAGAVSYVYAGQTHVFTGGGTTPALDPLNT